MEISRTKLLDADADNKDFKKDSNRREVTLDPGQLDDLLNFSDEDESDFENELSRQGSLDSILSTENSCNNNKSQKSSAENSPSKGHKRRHSLTVCETPINLENLRKPPQLDTQMSTLSNVTLSSESGSVTPENATPHLESPESPPLASDSIAQMQARLHAEFLQSVRLLIN